jgi:Rrf2 family protein
MRLSRKADYALRVLMTLVDRWRQGPVSMSELARLNDVPKKFLEHIMLDLKAQKWVESSTGRLGGYALAVSPERITLGQVVRYFDGVLAPVGCVSQSQPEACSQSATCRFRRVMLDVRNATAAYLDGATLAEVARREPVAAREVLTLGLADGDGI